MRLGNADPQPVPPELAPDIDSTTFGPHTVLTLIPPAHSDAHPLTLTIPVGALADLTFVDISTALTVLLAFAYLLAAAHRTARRLALPGPSKTKLD